MRMTENFDVEGFRSRLLSAIGSESQNSFARRAGISPAGLNRVMHGGIPGLDMAFAIANASGKSLDWLATGRGHEHVTPSHADVTQSSSLNLPLLCKVISTLEEWLAETEGEMTPENKASAILKIYDYVIDGAENGADSIQPRDIRKLLRLIV